MSPSTDAPAGADLAARFAPLPQQPAVVPAASAAQTPEPEVYDERDRLVMLTPCYGGNQTVIFRDSVHVAMTQAPKANFRCEDGKIRNLPILAMAINLPGDSHIDRARNNICHDALKTPYRKFLFCDGDQPFEPHDIALTWVRLMQGHPVVGGTVALKVLKATFACNTLRDVRTLDADGLLPGRDTGTGWLGFRREVLDDIRHRWPQFVRERISDALASHDIGASPVGPLVQEIVGALASLGYSADLGYVANPNSPHAGETVSAYFASGVAYRDGALDWLSEDWMFCLRCRLLGIPIKIDPNIRVKHLGPMLFPPDPSTLVEAALHAVSGKNPPFNPTLAAQAHAALQALVDDEKPAPISILHPTRRAEQALARWQQWRAAASQPAGYEYIFGVDEDDRSTRAALTAAGARFVVVPGGNGIVAAINAAAKEAKGRILVMAADDCEPPPHWDRLIREALKGQLHLPRLLWTSDGYTDQPVITHPIMTRALYEQQGWFFCPEYPHLFCDTDLTVSAQEAGHLIDARHIVLKHEHPMFTGAAPDALHQQRNSADAWDTGRAIFRRRHPGSNHPHALER